MENKTSKYLKYAIGEIVLVVIGILIALQINNWNESRKANENLIQLFERTQKELLYNIEQCNNAVDFYRDKDSLLFKVVNNNVTYDNYKQTPLLRNLIMSYQDCKLINDEFNNLIESKSPLSQKQDSIVLKLKQLYGLTKRDVDKFEIRAFTLVDNFLEKLKNEKEWFSNIFTTEASMIPDTQIDYYLTDPFYLNEVKQYEVYNFNTYIPQILHFRFNAMEIYGEISDYLHLEKNPQIVKNIDDYEHYIGAYNRVPLKDSIVFNIVREKNNLKAIILENNDTVVNTHIYPDSKDYFTVGNLRFGQVIYDENRDVTKIVLSQGSIRYEFIKKMGELLKN